MAGVCSSSVNLRAISGDCPQDMEKLDFILQDMVVGEFRKNTWLLVLQRGLANRNFDQHIESYGAQRAAAREIAPGSLLRDASAEVLDTIASGLLEGLGGYFARSLKKIPMRRHCVITKNISEFLP